ADVGFAYALVRCGTPEEFAANPDNRLRMTIALRKRRPLGRHPRTPFVLRDRLVPALRQRPQEDRQVRGALGESAHEIAVPLRAERYVHPDVIVLLGQPPLLGIADAIEH